MRINIIPSCSTRIHSTYILLPNDRIFPHGDLELINLVHAVQWEREATNANKVHLLETSSQGFQPRSKLGQFATCIPFMSQ